ncbi:MAG: efflux RND transporter periplasmic adaptor subunit [Methylophilaceae bacterium]
MMKKITTLSLLVIALASQGCEKAPDQPLPPRPALVAKVSNAVNAGTAMVLVGEVKSRYESNQSFRISGKIIERKAEVGDVVKKGQVLARIDATDSNLTTQAARADVASAQANYALAKAEVERQRQLVEKKFISQSALDLQEAKLKTTAARLKQVKAQAAVSSNQSRYTVLIADRDGVITHIRAEPGQVIEIGEVIAQIVDQEQIEVLVAVPESRMESVKINDEVTIKLWANQEKLYQGKVREITPAASEATRAFDMRVAIIDADEYVKLGMTAGVRFNNRVSESIIIPSTAVTQLEGKSIVWVIDEAGIANPREVVIGSFTEYGVVIINGLVIDEMIAVAGVHTLVKGQKVKPQIKKASKGRD